MECFTFLKGIKKINKRVFKVGVKWWARNKGGEEDIGKTYYIKLS